MEDKYPLISLIIDYKIKKSTKPGREKQEIINILDKAKYDIECLRNKYRHIPEDNFPLISKLELTVKGNKETVLIQTKQDQRSEKYLLNNFCEK
jgi:hypothetical protein